MRLNRLRRFRASSANPAAEKIVKEAGSGTGATPESGWNSTLSIVGYNADDTIIGVIFRFVNGVVEMKPMKTSPLVFRVMTSFAISKFMLPVKGLKSKSVSPTESPTAKIGELVVSVIGSGLFVLRTLEFVRPEYKPFVALTTNPRRRSGDT